MRKGERERQESIEWLRGVLKPGDTVYCVLAGVARSGMSRRINFYKMGQDGDLYLSGHIAGALGMSRDDRGAVKVSGCGMDMGFHVVYNLGATLWPDGVECTGEGCLSNDHSNGDRVYMPHMHRDGGYALRSRWL